MRKLVAFGDSFTEGLIKDPSLPGVYSEGSNSWEHRREISFVNKVSQMLGCEHENLAERGTGNYLISAEVWNYFRRNDVSNIVVFVGWSSFSRGIEHYDITKDHQSKYTKKIYDNYRLEPVAKQTLDEQLIFSVMQLCHMANVPLIMSNGFVDWGALENDAENQHLKQACGFNTLFCSQQWMMEDTYIEWGKPNNTMIDICAGTWLGDAKITDDRDHHLCISQDGRPDTIASCWHPTDKGHTWIAETFFPYIERKFR